MPGRSLQGLQEDLHLGFMGFRVWGLTFGVSSGFTGLTGSTGFTGFTGLQGFGLRVWGLQGLRLMGVLNLGLTGFSALGC